MAGAGLDLKGKDLVLKLDVEGQEIPTVAGAQRVIGEAGRVCFHVEINDGALERGGSPPEDLLGAVWRIRAVDWYVTDSIAWTIDHAKSVYAQLGSGI